MLLGAAPAIGLAIVAMGAVAPMLARLTHAPPAVWEYAIAATLGVLLTYAALYLFRRVARRQLRLYLNARGIRVCMGCGYNLRGVAGPRCPECGRAYEPPGGAAAGES